MKEGIKLSCIVLFFLCTLFPGVTFADVITGTSGDDILSGTSGPDTITDIGGTDQVDGGDGDDTIIMSGSNNGGTDVVNGGAGNDTITLTDSGNSTADGGIGNDTITVDPGYNVSYRNTIIGGPGDDTLSGFYSVDTYVFNPGDGHDTITDIGGTGSNSSNNDSIVFQGINSSVLAVSLSGNNLILTIGNPTDQITIKNWNNPQYRIEQFVFADATLSIADINARANNGEPTADAGADQEVRLPGNATLDGSGSSDPEESPLTYLWQIVAGPAGANATLTDPTTVSPAFTTDTPGVYTVELVVNDGLESSPADQVIITVLPGSIDVDLGLGFPEQQGGGGLVGDTVRILNGNMIQARSDLSFPSPNSFGLALSAFYNSRTVRLGAMGYGWSHTYEASLDTNYQYGSTPVFRLVDHTGRVSYYQWDEVSQRYEGMFHEKSAIVDEAGTFVWQRTDGSRFGFDASGALIWIDDEKGNRLELAYNGGQLETVIDLATGRSLQFHYDLNGRLDSVTGPITVAVPEDLGNPGQSEPWVTYYYDGNDNLSTVTYADLSGHKYDYTDVNDSHNLTAHRDMLDHLLADWSYDADDRCIANYSVAGTGADVAYVSATQVDVTDAYGVVRTYSLSDETSYGGRKRVIAMTGLADAPYGGNVAAWGYDGDLNLTQVTMVGGASHTYQDFDANGNPQTVLLAAGSPVSRTISYTYHPVLNSVLTRSEPSVLATGDKVTVYDYDDPADPDDVPTIYNENPTSLVHKVVERGYTREAVDTDVAYEYVTTLTYSADCGGTGLLGSVDGPQAGSGDLIAYGYDTDCNLLAITYPEGLAQTFASYDNGGYPAQATSVDNQTSALEYDGRLRVTRVTHLADNSFSTLTHNLAGQPASRTDEDGVVHTYTYDGATGRLATISDSAGNYILYSYDAQGNRVMVEKYDSLDTRSFLKTFSYNANIPGNLGSETSGDFTTYYSYNPAGNLASVTDPRNNVTARYYDGLNRLVETVNPGGQGSVFTSYDSHGNLTSVQADLDAGTPPDSADTTYLYDDLGRVVKIVSGDTNDTHLLHDPAGNLLSKTDANGVIVAYGYDDLNRMTSMVFPSDTQDNTPDAFLTYDSAANGAGKLAVVTEKDNGAAVIGSINYGYDSRSRLTAIASTVGTNTFNISRTYSAAGKLANLTYPSGRGESFTRNTLGQVSDIDTTVGGQTVALASNMAYYPFGSVGNINSGSGGNIENQTGECGCGVTVSNPGQPNEMNFSYDGNRNLLAVEMPNKPWRNESYTYDAMNRLETASTPAGSFSYTSDFQGNRLSATRNGATDTYGYIASSNVLDSISGANPAQYAYDYNGNITAIAGRTLGYDKRNRLLSASEDATELGSYRYNALNQRVSKTVNGVTTYFVHDFDGNIVAEADGNGDITGEFLYWGATRLARVDISGTNETLYFYLNDRLGTPKAITNTANEAVWEAVYAPFGSALVNVNSIVENNFRFPGQYYDEETGLHYNWNRYYDPSTGRYITPDPIGLAGGLNLYGYANQNPINYIDPFGLEATPKWVTPTVMVLGGTGGTLFGLGLYTSAAPPVGAALMGAGMCFMGAAAGLEAWSWANFPETVDENKDRLNLDQMNKDQEENQRLLRELEGRR